MLVALSESPSGSRVGSAFRGAKMKILILGAVLIICLPIAWVVAAVVVPIVLGAVGLALLPFILLGKLLIPALVIYLVFKVLVETPRRT